MTNDAPLTDSQWRIIKYLNFKMECSAEQEEMGVPLDYDAAVRHRDTLRALQEEKVTELAKVMPKVPKYAMKAKPKVTHKKDGTLSSHGEKWFQLLKEHRLKATHNEPIKVLVGYEEPNPNSHTQVKDWLFSLGWDPVTFKYDRDDEGNERKIPQVRGDDKLLCPSVVELKEKEPGIGVLEGLSIIQHRLSIFEGFVESAYRKNDQWYVSATIGGLTNTLRFKHRKPLVNLPKVGVPWGEEIRSCLIAPPGEVLCGSDMTSLESNTKKHYMFPHDPDYVQEMSVPGFDEHLDLAVQAGAIPREDYNFYVTASPDDTKTDRYKAVKAKRGPWKQTNYSGIYGVGAKKLARSLKCSVSEAVLLLEAYWKRNWSVRAVAKEQYIKHLPDGSMWLKNPVSGFYISLRNERDVFSSLNQSTGVYCFDKWIALCRAKGVKVRFQFHDEQGFSCPKGTEEKHRGILKGAIATLNKHLKLNVPLDVDVQFGENYARIH